MSSRNIPFIFRDQSQAQKGEAQLLMVREAQTDRAVVSAAPDSKLAGFRQQRMMVGHKRHQVQEALEAAQSELEVLVHQVSPFIRIAHSFLA